MSELAAQKPDWLLWLYKSKVALWECVCLSLDFEPDFVSPALQFPETHRRMAVLRKHVGARSKLLPPPRGYAWTGEDDSIHQAIDLRHFVKWAKLQGWVIPEGLSAGPTLTSSESDVPPVATTAAESLAIEMRLHREAIERANQARDRERILATMSEVARRTVANANRVKAVADNATATPLPGPVAPPVEPAQAEMPTVGRLGLSAPQAAAVFASLTAGSWDGAGWARAFQDPGAWLAQCRVAPGKKGHKPKPSTWCPMGIARALVEGQAGRQEAVPLKTMRARFTSRPELAPWRDEWDRYFMGREAMTD